MESTRVETLKSMLAQDPGSVFARYGLAMEYKVRGDFEDAAREFQALLSASPDYVPAYFQAGQTLERCGRTEEARRIYLEGVEAATRKGDGHARNEIQAALDLLE